MPSNALRSVVLPSIAMARLRPSVLTCCEVFPHIIDRMLRLDLIGALDYRICSCKCKMHEVSPTKLNTLPVILVSVAPPTFGTAWLRLSALARHDVSQNNIYHLLRLVFLTAQDDSF